jgi:hypothetical protein
VTLLPLQTPRPHLLPERHARPPLADDTRASKVLLTLIVVDEDLTVLTVAAGFLFRGLDDGEDVAGLLEDGVHFLEGAVGGFGVEEVDHGDYEGVSGRYLLVFAVLARGEGLT